MEGLDPFKEKRKPSLGEKEVQMGEWLLMGFRFLKIPMPLDSDPDSVRRVGVLIRRKWESLKFWKAMKKRIEAQKKIDPNASE